MSDSSFDSESSNLITAACHFAVNFDGHSSRNIRPESSGFERHNNSDYSGTVFNDMLSSPEKEDTEDIDDNNDDNDDDSDNDNDCDEDTNSNDNNDEDDDEDDEDNYDDSEEEMAGNNNAASSLEIDLNNLPERINEKIFQLLGTYIFIYFVSSLKKKLYAIILLHHMDVNCRKF